MEKIRYIFVLGTLCSILIIIAGGYYFKPTYLLFVFAIPLTVIGIIDMYQPRSSILRNFPVIGHLRYILLKIRPEIHQYFVESNSDGVPFSYEKRSVIYQRAKNAIDTLPFGTRVDVSRIGYEWINHSMLPKVIREADKRILVGGKDCTKPYSSSILNISGMSFGALSSQAITALNIGAKKGGFAHNTGEGSISSYHLKPGGDLIWQIGTAYFGCRDSNGNFDEELFKENALIESVKMIEIKLSQGAKPGHGGILPGSKVTSEIAKIRGVEIGKTVVSPPNHSAFSSPIEMMEFIQRLRELSGGKPIGLKLCLGKRREFYSLCRGMIEADIYPDFITVDGGEGGTGSAPIEFSNSLGTPLLEGLVEVVNALIGFGIRDQVSVFSSGKVMTGFNIIKNISLGADGCMAARSFMMALGCIQALKCNTGHCPTGVATQDSYLSKGLHITNKGERVYNLHKEQVKATFDLLGATGNTKISELKRWHILKRIHINDIKNYEELFPYPEEGSFFKEPYPEGYQRVLKKSMGSKF